MATEALILVDIQNDFLPGGALAVPEGDAVIPVVNRLQSGFDIVVASQDWHPADHLSFASQHEAMTPFEVTEVDGLTQILWPDHCVQYSHGAEFAPDLNMGRVDAVFRKGTDRRIDSYSAFHDNGHRNTTGLADWLRARDVTAVTLAGLAADVCVYFTAMDAVNEGFATRLVSDGTRGVDLQPGDVDSAFERMRAAGVEIVTSERLAGH
ncbi:MAG: bifunctional nicotinamidase/pyrazinamidase [Salinisphaeraceae bacterium]